MINKFFNVCNEKLSFAESRRAGSSIKNNFGVLDLSLLSRHFLSFVLIEAESSLAGKKKNTPLRGNYRPTERYISLHFSGSTPTELQPAWLKGKCFHRPLSVPLSFTDRHSDVVVAAEGFGKAEDSFRGSCLFALQNFRTSLMYSILQMFIMSKDVYITLSVKLSRNFAQQSWNIPTCRDRQKYMPICGILRIFRSNFEGLIKQTSSSAELNLFNRWLSQKASTPLKSLR